MIFLISFSTFLTVVNSFAFNLNGPTTTFNIENHKSNHDSQKLTASNARNLNLKGATVKSGLNYLDIIPSSDGTGQVGANDVYYFVEGENISLRCLLDNKNYELIVNKYDLATLYKSFFWSINNYQYTAHDLKQDFAHINVDFDPDFAKAKQAFARLNRTQSSDLAEHIYESIFKLFDLRITNISSFDEGDYYCGLRRNGKIRSSGYFSNVTRLTKMVPYGNPRIRYNEKYLADEETITVLYTEGGKVGNETYHPAAKINFLEAPFRIPDSQISPENFSLSDNLTLKCTATQGHPNGHLIWMTESGIESSILNFGTIDLNTPSTFTNFKAQELDLGQRDSPLVSQTQIVLKALNPSHNGKKIWCQAYQNVAGKKFKEASTSFKLDIRYKPIMEYGTDPFERIVYVQPGGRLQTECRVKGNPEPRVIWWIANGSERYALSENLLLFTPNISSVLERLNQLKIERSKSSKRVRPHGSDRARRDSSGNNRESSRNNQRFQINLPHKSSKVKKDTLNLLTTDLDTYPYLFCEATNEIGKTVSPPILIRFDPEKSLIKARKGNIIKNIGFIAVSAIIFATMLFSLSWFVMTKSKIFFHQKFLDKKMAMLTKNEEKYRVYNPHKPPFCKITQITKRSPVLDGIEEIKKAYIANNYQIPNFSRNVDDVHAIDSSLVRGHTENEHRLFRNADRSFDEIDDTGATPSNFNNNIVNGDDVLDLSYAELDYRKMKANQRLSFDSTSPVSSSPTASYKDLQSSGSLSCSHPNSAFNTSQSQDTLEKDLLHKSLRNKRVENVTHIPEILEIPKILEISKYPPQVLLESKPLATNQVALNQSLRVPLASIESTDSYLDLSAGTDDVIDSDYISKATPTPV